MNLIESMLIWNQLLESLQFLCFEIDETIIHIFPLLLNQLTGLSISISLSLSLSIYLFLRWIVQNPLTLAIWSIAFDYGCQLGNDSLVRFFEKNI